MAVPLFATCRQLLVTAANRQGLAPSSSARSSDQESNGSNVSRAQELLLRLGYLQSTGRADRYVVAEETPPRIDNWIALLDMASRVKRLFQLPCKQAPGAHFIGAEADPQAFGLDVPGQAGINAGGKGATLRRAFESCIGEAAEHLSFRAWGDEPIVEAKIEDMVEHGGEGGAPSDLKWMLDATGLGSTDRRREIGWLTAQSLDGAAPIQVPAALCLGGWRERDGQPLRKAESNGCAAASTKPRACYAALMELIERDAVALWWYGGGEASALRLDPEGRGEIGDFVARLRREKLRRLWLLDLTSDLHIPVVGALSCDPAGSNVICGFSADLDPPVAAQKAILEMCQMELALDLVHLKIAQSGMGALNDRDRDHLDRLKLLSLDCFPRLGPASETARSIATRPRTMTHEEKLAASCARLRRSGHRAYWIDLSRPALAIPAVRVLVPGLQSAKPDWVSDRLRRASSENALSDAERRALPPIV